VGCQFRKINDDGLRFKISNLFHSFAVPDGLTALECIDDNVWATRQGSILVFDTLTNELVKEVQGAHKKKINQFHARDQHVWTASDDGTIGIWKKDPVELVKRIETNSGKVKSLSTIDDLVFCCSWDTTIRVYLDTYELACELKNQHTDAVSHVLFYSSTQKKKLYAWSSSYDGSVCIWYMPDTKKIVASLRRTRAVQTKV